MQPTVIFRDFEERDIDFIYKCKNDEELNSLIVGHYHPFTYEEAVNWVHGCMGEHETFKFWAIATNDEEQRIVGWVALSHIDKISRSVETHSLVINDPDYSDGIVWLETALHMYRYSFEVLKMHKVYGRSLVGHSQSNLLEKLLYLHQDGVLRDEIFKNGRYYDVSYTSILEDEYYAHKEAGDYEIRSLIKRIRPLRHE